MARPGVRVWLTRIDDAVAGLLELEAERSGDVGTVQLGLVPEFLGRGFGGAFLTLATELAWSIETPAGQPRRVWLQTYSTDHRHALPNYKARGFRVFRTEAKTETPDQDRNTRGVGRNASVDQYVQRACQRVRKDRIGLTMAGASDLYHALLDAWNRHDAHAYAALFTDDGHVVGFDGSEMNGRDEIERSLSAIFADHETGRYVAKVRSERTVSDRVVMLAAVAGLVPAGQSDLNPELNAMQTLVAKDDGDRWRIVLLQNTPAHFHGQPEKAEALTDELRSLV